MMAIWGNKEHLTCVFPLWFSHEGPKSFKNVPNPRKSLTPIGSCRDLHMLLTICRHLLTFCAIMFTFVCKVVNTICQQWLTNCSQCLRTFFKIALCPTSYSVAPGAGCGALHSTSKRHGSATQLSIHALTIQKSLCSGLQP